MDFNASNLTGVFFGNERSLAMSVIVVNDDIDEEDEIFAVLLELVSAVNPDRVDLSERNISLIWITDDDGECECVVLSALMYVECIIPLLILSLSPPLPLLPSFPFSRHGLII